MFIFLTEVYSAITGFPWTVYFTFVLEEKHGFNKQVYMYTRVHAFCYVFHVQTPSFFMKDQVKKFVLGCVLNLAIMAGLISVIRWGGNYFYIYAWFFVLLVSVVSCYAGHSLSSNGATPPIHRSLYLSTMTSLLLALISTRPSLKAR